ncbi:hypothetical protein [Bosea sp. (in: a-proteobacteria)]|jgi:hypothetical protein|uniref:hypothetical protein n=1 Tax=Bosea sp. (in: a-proteobacteria) TaxID=1871050 RepID=UPI003F712DCD
MAVGLALFAVAPGWAEDLPKARAKPAPDRYAFDPLSDEVAWEMANDPVLTVPVFVAPRLDRNAAYQARAERNGLIRPPIKTTVIRQGLATAPRGPTPATERAVGVKLEPDRFSLATSFITGSGTWQAADTRFDWALSRNVPADALGLVWDANTGGGIGFSGTAEQRAGAALGFRTQLFDHVTLTSQLALATSYAFAADNLFAASVTPQIQVLADLSQPMASPWKTVLDVKLSRQVPLASGEFDTSASAMLRLNYTLR